RGDVQGAQVGAAERGGGDLADGEADDGVELAVGRVTVRAGVRVGAEQVQFPHGSGLPSLNLTTARSTVNSPRRRRSWPSGPARAKPSTRASTSPPPRVSPKVPTGSPASNQVWAPVTGSSACTWPGRMSTHRSRP